MKQGVQIWEEEVSIPTYEAGKADKNPMFLDKRVYQGSCGKVYPYPVIESVSDEKKEKSYRAVWLENEYLKVMVLPELGGRIQRAYDKTNGYDFVYYNHVIKPALVGLTGPWISGGIEFNWPQHHRPTTFMPTDYLITEGEDGSKSVCLHDVDRMYGTKGIAKITLYPGKAYIEIKGQLYNRTNLPQTFLWWANPAVPVNDYTQSVFPPDVHAVMDHGKRDVSRFPIATGVYYKHDYSEGVDISRYKNIPVPTSYMAEKSNFDFVGGYDDHVKAGILHVADHHISPGKKQWTWGCGDFGQAWDNNLTDEDGPYIELMTGVYTDNQPDFTWLKPFEEKTFTQYFMPYKEVGRVRNATIEAAVNLELEKNLARICVYATSVHEEAVISLYRQGILILEETCRLSPEEVYHKELSVPAGKETDFTVTVCSQGKTLVSYTPLPEEISRIPEPAEAAKRPEELATCEELFLTGQHLEQYRHATYDPDPYYLEGLKRDPLDARINNAYGLLLLRRGCFAESIPYFEAAIRRLTWKNPNPYNSEAYYHLGLALLYLDRMEEAYDAFFKAAWSNEQQEMAYYYLAAILSRKGAFPQALEMIEKALIKNSHNLKARGMKAVLLRKLGRREEAKAWLNETLQLDGFDGVCRQEAGKYRMEAGEAAVLENVEADRPVLLSEEAQRCLLTAVDYADGGFWQEAQEALARCGQSYPMVAYYQAYYAAKLGQEEAARDFLKQAEGIDPAYCFPNRPEDIAVLEYAVSQNPEGAKAHYYLGLLWYDRRQRDRSRALWEKAVGLDPAFATLHRNLALVYFNTYQEAELAQREMETAFSLNQADARVFLELDQLYKRLGYPVAERLHFYENNRETFLKRDDLLIEYITLLNDTGRHQEAYDWAMSRRFHPWEGGEGKITAQYTTALCELAREAQREGRFEDSIRLLEKALIFPRSLGEGKLEGSKDNIVHYYLGVAQEALGLEEEAKNAYRRASVGSDEVAGMMYYNDQPADLILYQGMALQKLGDKAGANARFYRLLDYGERHLQEKMSIGYFAVSLPDFLIWNSDLDRQNQAHCYYLMGMGNLGIGKKEKAQQYFSKALELDCSHQKCILFEKAGKCRK